MLVPGGELRVSRDVPEGERTRLVRRPGLRGAFELGVFAMAYYVAYRYGMSFSEATASPFWFPDSVLLCALLRTRPGRWWLFILAIVPIRLFSEVAQDVPLWFLLTTFANDSIKGLVSAFILRRLLTNPLRFETVRDFGIF